MSKEAEGCRDIGVSPSLDPCIVARKPLDGTVAENVLAHGTGALNIDGCRVECSETLTAPRSDPEKRRGVVGRAMQASGGAERNQAAQAASIARTMELGRWPANLIHDGSEEVMAGFPQRVGMRSQCDHKETPSKYFGAHKHVGEREGYNDSGSAARFFYCAKASKAERGEGNNHPTVKPVALMRYLCRLVTPPGGTVLDPFMGSGSTGIAAVLEGFGFIGIERELEYLEIARARTAHALQSNRQQTLPL
jgi:site-specific DNA-methyltransferase (adenine-specific)